jgi:cell division septal protein FtsQ
MPRGQKSNRTPRSELRASYVSQLAGEGAPELGRGPGRFAWSKIVSLVLLVAAVALVGDLLRSARFRVARVEITGIDLIEANDVLSRLDVAGAPVFSVRTHMLEAALKESLPLAERVRIRGVLPDGLQVRVTEKQAIVAWESGGRYWWIGDGGKVLGTTAEAKGRPVIHDAKNLDPDPQGYVLGVPWDLAMAVAQTLATEDRLEYGLEEGLIAMIGAGNYAVLIGYDGDAGKKMAMAGAVSQQLADRRLNIEYIDVRTEDRPTVKLR